MRRLIVGAIAVAATTLAVTFLAMSLGSETASADGGPHVSGKTLMTDADSCAGCHRVHTGQDSNLLKTAEASLCYTCHGNAGTGSYLDVEWGEKWAGPGYRAGAITALKAGGFAKAMINTADTSQAPSDMNATGVTIGVLGAPAAATSQHSIDGTTQKTWGNGAAGGTGAATYANFALGCASCHDPHGNGNYRILRPQPGPGAGAAVNPSDETVKAYTTTDYFSVNYGTGIAGGGPTSAQLSSWCAQCHTRYLATAGSDPAHTPLAGESVFKYRHVSEGGTGIAFPGCIKCHTAHGTNATASGANSSIVPLPDNLSAAVGGSRLLKMNDRGMCLKCHKK